MANYKDAFYDTTLSNSENVESWEEGGSKDMRVRANEKWKSMLEGYKAPAIDEGVREALQAFVARRKEEIPVAWY